MFAAILTMFTVVVVQNNVFIEIRLLYFSDWFDSVETRLGTALIAAGIVGFVLGLLVRRGSR